MLLNKINTNITKVNAKIKAKAKIKTKAKTANTSKEPQSYCATYIMPVLKLTYFVVRAFMVDALYYHYLPHLAVTYS